MEPGLDVSAFPGGLGWTVLPLRKQQDQLQTQVSPIWELIALSSITEVMGQSPWQVWVDSFNKAMAWPFLNFRLNSPP